MLNKLKQLIKKNYKLYYGLKLIFGKDEMLQKISKAYCDGGNPILLIEGDKNDSNKYYYLIELGVDKNRTSGFFALVRDTMRLLLFAEMNDLSPCPVWGKYVQYYDSSILETENVFEYFFEPISISYNDLKKNKERYIRAKNIDLTFIPEKNSFDKDSYLYTDNEIELYAYLYKKYFVLNKKIFLYLEQEVNDLFGLEKEILGIHIRGTDFKRQLNRHPEFVQFENYLIKVREILKNHNYKNIFLATDDIDALNLFKQEFGEILLYYADCARGQGNTSVHIDVNRKPYFVGRDVLRDVYSLVRCNGLVCGRSHVALAAQYIKRSQGEAYEIIDFVKQTINNNNNELSYTKWT